MKLEEKVLNVEYPDWMQPSDFCIAANKKSFQVLSSDIYPYKIKAVIRELSTNAMDSHIEAGKPDLPFEVHLPNSFEPYFSVKDNGVGLTEEKMKIYTTYFSSDKTHTNDLTGCIGIGSKSPFAYADSFMIENRYNGKKYTSNAFVNQHGYPSLVPMGVEDTDECNGVEVKIAVKEGDFKEFNDWAVDVLSWFSVRPIVKGNPKFKFNDREYVIKKERYGIRKENAGRSYVVMGNVAYNLDRYGLNLDSLESSLVGWGVELYFDLGEAQVTPSREELSYTPEVKEKIKQCLKEAIKDVQEDIQKEFDEIPTLWQARRKLNDMQHGILGQVRDMGTITWKGEKLTAYFRITSLDETDRPLLQSTNRKNERYSRSEVSTIEANGVVIFNNDLERGGYARISHYLRSNHVRFAYIISNVTDKFLEASGVGEAMIPASTLDKPPRKPRSVVRVRDKSVLMLYEDCGHDVASKYWEEVEVELKEGGIYVELSHYKIVKPGKESQHPEKIRHILNNIYELAGKEIKVYGVRTADLKKLHKYGKWIELDDYAKKLVEENKHYYQLKIKACSWRSLNDKRFEDFFKRNLSNSAFSDFVSKCKEAKEAKEDQKVEAFGKLSDFYGMYEVTDADYLNQDARELLNRYPLLHYLNWYHSRTESFAESVMDYIKIKESQATALDSPSKEVL